MRFFFSISSSCCIMSSSFARTHAGSLQFIDNKLFSGNFRGTEMKPVLANRASFLINSFSTPGNLSNILPFVCLRFIWAVQFYHSLSSHALYLARGINNAISTSSPITFFLSRVSIFLRVSIFNNKCRFPSTEQYVLHRRALNITDSSGSTRLLVGWGDLPR